MKTKKPLLVLALLGCMYALFSCIYPEIKDVPDCTGNCVDVTISGKLYVKTDGTEISNIPIEAFWYQKECDYCHPYYTVASGVSGSDGTFSFKTTIDSTFFQNYELRIVVVDYPNSYVMKNSGIKYFNRLDVVALQNMKFEFYYVTHLIVKLNRILSDSSDVVTINLHLDDGSKYTQLGNYNLINNGDSVGIYNIAADIYTKIWWWDQAISKKIYLDSIICTRNGPNVFIIDY
jgi:hypothetical protein